MEQAFKCKLCSKEFPSSNGLKLHNEHQHRKCNLCDYETRQESQLINHMRAHTGERPFKCTIPDCELSFKQESALKNRIKSIHSDARPLKCNFPDCNYTAKISMQLTSHKKKHTDLQAYACSKCDYKTSWRHNIKAHKMRQHSGRRDFKCGHPECTKSFKSSSELQQHFSNRHGERKIKCDLPGCGRKFANPKGLSEHKRNVHSKKSLEGSQNKGHQKTPLVCSLPGCGHHASTKKALEDHIKLHNPSNRPFQCPLCFKYYQTLNKLQIHSSSHTKEKPFGCGYCDYAASSRQLVKIHISAVHAATKFPFIVHLLDDRECLRCEVTLRTAEFLLHYEEHAADL